MSEPTLRKLLDSARSATSIDPVEFAKWMSVTADGLARIAGEQVDLVSVDFNSPRFQTYMRQPIAVLREALALNEDEALVLQWFREIPLPEFGMKTPATLVSEGKVESLLRYIQSIASGSSG